MSKKFHERLLKGTGVHARPFHSRFASMYMKKLGWQEGQGLGREKNGRIECLQIRRREEKVGLGHENASETKAQDQWKNWWDDLYNTMASKLKTARTRKSSTSSAFSEEENGNEVFAARCERRSYATQRKKSVIAVKGSGGQESSTYVWEEETSLTTPRAATGLGFSYDSASSAAQYSSTNRAEGLSMSSNAKGSEKSSGNSSFCRDSTIQPATAKANVELNRTEKMYIRGLSSHECVTYHAESGATENKSRRKSICSRAVSAAAADCCSSFADSTVVTATISQRSENIPSLCSGNIDTEAPSSADTLYGFVRGKATREDVPNADNVSTAADAPTNHFNAKETYNTKTLQSSTAVAAAAALSRKVYNKKKTEDESLVNSKEDETAAAEQVAERQRRRGDKKRRRKHVDEQQREYTAVETPLLETRLQQNDNTRVRATAMLYSSEQLEKGEAQHHGSMDAEKLKKKEKMRSKRRMNGVMTQLALNLYEKISDEEPEAAATIEKGKEVGVGEDFVFPLVSKEKKREKKRRKKIEMRKIDEQRDEDQSREPQQRDPHDMTGFCVAERITSSVTKESTKRDKKHKREKEARELK